MGQSYAMPGQPMGQPYGAPGYGQAPPPPPKKKTGLIILICILIVALVGGGIGAYFLFFTNKDDPNKPVVAGQAKTPEAAVRGYLQALAAGNSADALSFAATAPSDTTFLTDDVLAASNAISPITNITVIKDTTSSSQYATVTATYQIGSQSVNTKFDVTQYGKYYKLDDVVNKVYMIAMFGDGIDLTLNGVAITSGALSSSVSLFPGTYKIDVDNSLLSLTGNQFVVTDPTSYDDAPDMTLALTSDAATQFADAAKKTLDDCMAEQATLTSCGFGTAAPKNRNGDPIDIDANTIKWTFESGSSDDFSADTFDYYPYSAPTQASSYFVKSIHIRIDVADTTGALYYQSYSLYQMKVDFSDPTNIVVTFS